MALLAAAGDRASALSVYESLRMRLREHQNPIVAHVQQTGSEATVTFSDFVAPRAFHRLEIYRDLYGPMGVEDQLATLLEVVPGRIIGIALNRDRRSFTERERELLALVRPHLVAAHRNVASRAGAVVRIGSFGRGR